MKFIGLISGGKDSIFNITRCIEEGHELVCLLNMRMPTDIDSYMYQQVGYNLTEAIAECIGVPLEIANTSGVAQNTDLEYSSSPNDEVEDLFKALKQLKEKYSFEGVSSGAIKSQYQYNRVSDICSRLGLHSLTYLWQSNQKDLLKQMIERNIKAIIIKAGEYPLTDLISEDISTVYTKYNKYIQEQIDQSKGILKEEDFNICGEGGEYETITLDAPIFKRSILITASTILTDKENRKTLSITNYTLKNK
ncbi:diphthine-ammonia ligase [Nematocida sp. AWRm80]|nr:diphthine-ammonia ligase [Nematocida sp. AWRm80]